MRVITTILRYEPARSVLGPAVAHNWLKRLMKIHNSGENPRETQPLAVIKRGIDLIGWFSLAGLSWSILERFVSCHIAWQTGSPPVQGHGHPERLSQSSDPQRSELPADMTWGQVLGRHLLVSSFGVTLVSCYHCVRYQSDRVDLFLAILRPQFVAATNYCNSTGFCLF